VVRSELIDYIVLESKRLAAGNDASSADTAGAMAMLSKVTSTAKSGKEEDAIALTSKNIIN